jgi:hypothetical protein
MPAMKVAMPLRFTIGALVRLIALVAANCAILRYYVSYVGEHLILPALLVGLLPLINASVFGVSAIASGYRIKLRRRQADEIVPFWVRFGLVSGVALCAALIAVAVAPASIAFYVEFAEQELNRCLSSLGMIRGTVDYGPLLPRLAALWTLLSGPPLVAICLICAVSGRYRLTIDRTT